jgi:hypothetical protein
MSGLVRPSIVGPCELKLAMVEGVAQFDAPTASSPGLALSAGVSMLVAATDVPNDCCVKTVSCNHDGWAPDQWKMDR